MKKMLEMLYRDNEGAVGTIIVIVAILLLGIIAIGFFAFIEDIAKAVLYLAVAFLIIIGTGIIAKRFLFRGGRR